MPPAQPRLADYLATDAERPFLDRALTRTLGDDDRLRYARLLESSDPARAEWLRLEVTLHSHATADPAELARFLELAHRIGLDFADLLLRDEIKNCGRDTLRSAPPPVRFSFACTKRWETLAPTDTTSVRFCQQCKERVYYCDTVADAETRALAGQCIAIPKQLADHSVDDAPQLGRPSPAHDWGSLLFTLGPGNRDAVALRVIHAGKTELLEQQYILDPSAVTTIGRGPENTIVLDNHAASRSHAHFERRADGWWVVDDGSTNGTHVNDERITERRLHRRDRIHIGNMILLLDSPRTSEPRYSATPIDRMTGVYNRRHLIEQIVRILRSTASPGRPLALALFDIKEFILINDVHGHLAGDAVLRELAGLLQTHARAHDVLARVGGDEFAMLLPATDPDTAATIVDIIRKQLSAHTFLVGETNISMTVSAGLAHAGDEDSTADPLLLRADEALFAARRASQ